MEPALCTTRTSQTTEVGTFCPSTRSWKRRHGLICSGKKGTAERKPVLLERGPSPSHRGVGFAMDQVGGQGPEATQVPHALVTSDRRTLTTQKNPPCRIHWCPEDRERAATRVRPCPPPTREGSQGLLTTRLTGRHVGAASRAPPACVCVCVCGGYVCKGRPSELVSSRPGEGLPPRGRSGFGHHMCQTPGPGPDPPCWKVRMETVDPIPC